MSNAEANEVQFEQEKADLHAAFQARGTAFLKHIADHGFCKGCGAGIWWVKHLNGKAVPYDDDLTNHFATCPKAKDFHKPKEVK